MRKMDYDEVKMLARHKNHTFIAVDASIDFENVSYYLFDLYFMNSKGKLYVLSVRRISVFGM